MIPDAEAFRRDLLEWYARSKRDLPWRRDRDPYRVWISEIMLQQTRVAAVIPYFDRFLGRFPSIEALATAPEQDLLAAWAGLGYYSRARNLQRAARSIHADGKFPGDYSSIRAIPGVGDYTAAAVSSIAFGLPHAAMDGNVVRVLARVSAFAGDVRSGSSRKALQSVADRLIDPQHPGDFNEALMELGATVCLPQKPQCLLCPVEASCQARRLGRQEQLPIASPKAAPNAAEKVLLLIQRGGSVLFRQREANDKRLAGFWELPERDSLRRGKVSGTLGTFRHTIVNTTYRVTVQAATISRPSAGFQWIEQTQLNSYPLTTMTKKALRYIAS